MAHRLKLSQEQQDKLSRIRAKLGDKGRKQVVEALRALRTRGLRRKHA